MEVYDEDTDYDDVACGFGASLAVEGRTNCPYYKGDEHAYAAPDK